MVSWSITTVMVINLSLVSGIEFDFDYPSEIQADEEFEVLINFETTEIYDVKIYVYDDVKASSEIWDGSAWKSTHFYLKDVFPNQKKFRLKAYDIGETDICVQLRKSGSGSFDKVCDSINVLESDGSDSGSDDFNSGDNDSGNGDGENNSDDGDGGGDNKNSGSDNSGGSGSGSEGDSGSGSGGENGRDNYGGDWKSSDQSNGGNKKIVLNSPIVDDNSDLGGEVFVSKQSKVRRGVLWGFLALCVFIIALLALKKL